MVSEDLLDNFNLKATVHPTYTLHPLYVRGLRAQSQTKWERKEMIGEGAFGLVWREENLAADGSERERAVKVIRKQQMSRRGIDFKRELLALAKLSKEEYRRAEVIVSFLGWFENDESVFLAMEYFQHGDLARHIPNITTEDEVRQITIDLLEGLKIIHSEGFTHRDLKPQNVFVAQKPPQSTKWWVKIGDFGISKRVRNEETALRTQTGTPHFQAPEIHGFIEDDKNASVYSNAVDIWSVGCIVFNISAHRVPFLKSIEVFNFCHNKLGLPKDLLRPVLGAAGVSFVESLIVADPSRRITVTRALEDAWIVTAPSPNVPSIQTPSSRSEFSPLKPAPGKAVSSLSLDELYRRDGLRIIPHIVVKCVQAVDLYGLTVESIYRTEASAGHVMGLRAMFDHDPSQVDFRYPSAFFNDITAVATLLKHFLRELEEPLLTSAQYNNFMAAAKVDDDSVRRDRCHAIINGFSDPHYNTLRLLILHLHRVSQRSTQNRMTAKSLANIFGPMLMVGQADADTEEKVAGTGWQVRVLETIINGAFDIFDDDEVVGELMPEKTSIIGLAV